MQNYNNVSYRKNRISILVVAAVSVETYLPIEYTDKVLLISEGGKVVTPKSTTGMYKTPMIFDSEVIVENAEIDTSLYRKTGTQTFSELNAVTAILAIDAPESKEIQKTQAPLSFILFDCLVFKGENICKQPLSKRRLALEYALDVFNKTSELPFRLSPWVLGKDKQAFYEDIVAKGGEGVVLKRLDSPYIDTTSRKRDGMVKLKRSMSETIKEDLDAYIIGYLPADRDKSWSLLVGALKMAVSLKDDTGMEAEHWVATISAMPMSMREQITEIGYDGLPRLKEKYYGKVLTINGQSMSSKNLRLNMLLLIGLSAFEKIKGLWIALRSVKFLERNVF